MKEKKRWPLPVLALAALLVVSQIYISHKASRPAVIRTEVLVADSPMPRVQLEGGESSSLCPAAPWSLAHLRAHCRAGPLRYFYAYAAIHSSWNAFDHIRRHLASAPLLPTTARPPPLLPDDRMRPPVPRAAGAGYAVPHEEPTLLVGAPQLLVTPNYWKPHAQDWRQWRLSPAQRINRMWGMEAVSKKDKLVQTLERRYGMGACPLMPASFRWSELARTGGWRRVVSNATLWMLKTTAHRGQGLRLVSSEEVLRAAEGGRSSAAYPAALAGDVQMEARQCWLLRPRRRLSLWPTRKPQVPGRWML